MDKENVPHYYSDTEIIDNFGLSAPVHNVYQRAFALYDAQRYRNDTFNNYGLFRRNGACRILKRYEPDPDSHRAYM